MLQDSANVPICQLDANNITDLGSACTVDTTAMTDTCPSGLTCVPEMITFTNGTTANSGYAGGYCTTNICSDDSDCSLNSLCGPINMAANGACTAPCTVDTDCRTAEGYSCVDFDGDGTNESCLIVEASGPGVVGDPCTATSECGGGINGTCLTEFTDMMGMVQRPGGYCTTECTNDPMNACAAGEQCIQFGSDPMTARGFCIKDCGAGGTCPRAGFTCRPMVNVCL